MKIEIFFRKNKSKTERSDHSGELKEQEAALSKVSNYWTCYDQGDEGKPYRRYFRVCTWCLSGP